MGYLLLIFGTVIEVPRSTNNNVQPKHTSIQETDATLHSQAKTQNVKRRQKFDQLSDVDYVPLLYIFDDNKAVIRMSDVFLWPFEHSDQVGKQSAISERGQKTTSNEGSPTVKANPCLVLREQRSEEISSRSLGSLVNPENADERKEVE